MSNDEVKYWQQLAGEFASLANWAANELTGCKDHISGNVLDQANDVLDRVIPYLVFDEREL